MVNYVQQLTFSVKIYFVIKCGKEKFDICLKKIRLKILVVLKKRNTHYASLKQKLILNVRIM